MPTSNEQLDELRRSVQETRQAVADAVAQRESLQSEIENDIVAAQLLAEKSQLDRILLNELAASSEESVRSGAAAVVASSLGLQNTSTGEDPPLDTHNSKDNENNQDENAGVEGPTAESLKSGWGV